MYCFVAIYQNNPSLRQQLFQVLPQIIAQRDLRKHVVRHPQFVLQPYWPETDGIPLQLQVESICYENGQFTCPKALVIDIEVENPIRAVVKYRGKK